MSGMANVTLFGNVGQDPEIRYSGSGTAIVNFSVATSRKQGGDEVTDWHSVVAFGKTAELINEYVTKGNQVVVNGSLQYDKYTDSNGVDRVKAKVVVNTFAFVSSRNTEEVQSDSVKTEVSEDDIPF